MGKKEKRKKNIDRRTALEKQAKERYLEMKDGVKIRVLEFDLATKANKYELLFIPGFLSIFQVWDNVLNELKDDFHIYYLETREKSSSIMPNRKAERNITLEKKAYDIKEVVEQLGLTKRDYIIVCSSASGTILSIALSNNWFNPNGAVWIGPTIISHLKLYMPLLGSLTPAFMQKMFLPLIKWSLKSYIDTEAEPEQYEKYIRYAEEAQIRKLRKSSWEMYKYNGQHLLPKIRTRSLLVGASSDKLHLAEETLENSKLMPNAKFIDIGSNRATQEKPMADIIVNFAKELAITEDFD